MALTAVTAACGDDDGSDASGPSETSSGAPTDTNDSGEPSDTSTASEGSPATGDPVTIGVISSETGASQARAIEVLQATADDINENGGLNGHPIELVHTDVQADVALAQSAIAELPDDIIAVFLSSPSTETAIAESLDALGVPILGVGYSTVVWGGEISIFGLTCDSDPTYCAQPNFMTSTPTVEQAIAQQLAGASAIGATAGTSFSCAEVDSCAASDPIFQAIGESYGLKMSPTIRVSSTSADYAAECIQVIQDGLDFVQMSISGAALTNAVKSCLDQGYEGTFGASAGSVDTSVLESPGVFSGGLNGFPWFVDDPQVQEYVDLMTSAGVPDADWQFANGTAIYSSMLLLREAIADYADPDAPLDGTAALDAMFQVDGEDLGGLLANPVSFDPDVLERTRPCFWLYTKDADGNLENPNGGLATQCYPEK